MRNLLAFVTDLVDELIAFRETRFQILELHQQPGESVIAFLRLVAERQRVGQVLSQKLDLRDKLRFAFLPRDILSP